MTIVWHYISEGTLQGPVSFERLEHLLTNQTLPESTLVWRSGMARRLPASEVSEFQRCTSRQDRPPRVDEPGTDSHAE